MIDFWQTNICNLYTNSMFYFPSNWDRHAAQPIDKTHVTTSKTTAVTKCTVTKNTATFYFFLNPNKLENKLTLDLFILPWHCKVIDCLIAPNIEDILKCPTWVLLFFWVLSQLLVFTSGSWDLQYRIEELPRSTWMQRHRQRSEKTGAMHSGTCSRTHWRQREHADPIIHSISTAIWIFFCFRTFCEQWAY